MLVVYSLFFAWRANLDISRPLLLGVVSYKTFMFSDIFSHIIAEASHLVLSIELQVCLSFQYSEIKPKWQQRTVCWCWSWSNGKANPEKNKAKKTTENTYLPLCVSVCVCGIHLHGHFLQVERFWLQSDAAVCVLAGLGLSWTLAGLERRLGYGGLWKTTGWVFTAALLAHMVHTNHRWLLHTLTVTSLLLFGVMKICSAVDTQSGITVVCNSGFHCTSLKW